MEEQSKYENHHRERPVVHKRTKRTEREKHNAEAEGNLPSTHDQDTASFPPIMSQSEATLNISRQDQRPHLTSVPDPQVTAHASISSEHNLAHEPRSAPRESRPQRAPISQVSSVESASAVAQGNNTAAPNAAQGDNVKAPSAMSGSNPAAAVHAQSYQESTEQGSSFVPVGAHIRDYNMAAAHSRQHLGIGVKIFFVLIAAGVVAIVCWWMLFSPISITLNGKMTTVDRGSNVSAIVKSQNVNVSPGRLLAVDGSVIDQTGGETFTATLDGQAVNGNAGVKENSTLTITDGADKTEDYTETTKPIPSQWVDDGTRGAFHEVVGEAADGIAATRTGKISGITVDNQVVKEPVNPTLTRYSIDTGGEKVIALTFDDGPWKDQTAELLDILDQNNAKATFFVVGNRIGDTPGGGDLVKREYDSGHQVSSHTWDHAAGSGKGVNLGYMTEDEQINEIVKGQQAITDATGVEANKIVRTPGGNYSLETAQIVHPYVDVEVDWNIDTEDWRRPGAAKIESAILSAKPGNVILMHDGGGDRSQTVQAVADALPKLREQGYRFVTIEELWEYHKKAQQQSN